MVSSTTNAEREAQEFHALAKQRLDRLVEERRQVADRMADLQVRIDAIDEEIEHLRALISPQTHAEEVSTSPTGVAVADAVVALLEETREPMHYRDIEAELRKRGQAFGTGANPANALLARYFNDPRLYRPRRGTYGLRAWDRSAKSVGVKRAKTRRRRA